MLRVSGETLTWGDQNGAIYQQQTVYDYYGKTPQLNGITVNLYGGEGETQISSKTYRYTYDQNGNITEIKDAANVVQNKYYYDDLGQLIREDNRALNKTYTYEYDAAGNMLYKRQCAFTLAETLPTMSTIFDMTHETYNGWGDQMDMDNINYYDFTYDKVGNLVEVYYPEEYFLFTWEGRQLTSAKWYYDDYSYSTPIRFNYYDVQYTYNESGIRTSKTVDGIKHEYLLNGSQIVAETWTQNGIEYMLRYIYDESGAPIGMKYRTSQQAAEYYTLYFFEKNAFGDIIGIYNSAGDLLGTYTYDAWGNCVVSGTDAVLQMNPFRYRGYYYDTETGFYYLQSRYYNPAWGRFLNADHLSYLGVGNDLLSNNVYIYCNNNPVMMRDQEGEFPFHILAGAVVGATVNALITMYEQHSNGEEIDWAQVGISAASGALSGALAATGFGPAAQVVGNALISGAETAISSGIENGFENIDAMEVAMDAIEGGLTSVNNGVGKGTAKHLWKQGDQLVKNITRKGAKKALKYYWSQTANLFYKPLINDAIKELNDALS